MDTSDNPGPVDTTPRLKVMWQSQVFDESRSGHLSGRNMKPELYNNMVISSYYQILSDDTEDLFAFDKVSGDTIWIWSDFNYREFGERSLTFNDRPRCKNIMYYPTEEGNYVINLDDGSTHWKNRGKGSPNFSDRTLDASIGCTVFQQRQFGGPAGDSIHLYQIDMFTGFKKIIYKTYEVGGFYPTIKTPIVWEENGDTIIAFYTSYITYFGPIRGKKDSVNMICVNLTKNDTIWNLYDYDPEGWGNFQGPRLNDGRLYVAGRNTLYCISPSNGEILWSHRDVTFGSLHTADFVFSGEAVFYKSGSGYVISLDKVTGSVIWEVRDTGVAGTSSSRMNYYKGKLIYSDTRLIVLDAETGKNIAKIYSPNESREYPDTRFSHITIDIETGLAYAGDGYFIMCFEVPE